jgi:RimJ/RimL family protein N-acetyltransferase
MRRCRHVPEPDVSVHLQPLDQTHQPLLTALEQQDDVWESIGALPLSAYEKGNHAFVIVDEGMQLGFVGLFKSQAAGQDDFELLCATRADAQRHGIAKEACRKTLAWALNDAGGAKLERVIAVIDEANQPARSIATKIGMTELGPAPGNRVIYVKYAGKAAKSKTR